MCAHALHTCAAHTHTHTHAHTHTYSMSLTHTPCLYHSRTHTQHIHTHTHTHSLSLSNMCTWVPHTHTTLTLSLTNTDLHTHMQTTHTHTHTLQSHRLFPYIVSNVLLLRPVANLVMMSHHRSLYIGTWGRFIHKGGGWLPTVIEPGYVGWHIAFPLIPETQPAGYAEMIGRYVTDVVTHMNECMNMDRKIAHNTFKQAHTQ